MTRAATVLIPTFDHGPTLRHSVGSVLSQSVADLEVFIVGDGVSDEVRRFIRELVRTDGRIRFFDNPKGPSRGEVHRHRALSEARGEIVCYLSDDDLWLPDHVATMRELLRDADFANTLPLSRRPDGSLSGWTVDLGLPHFRELLLSGENRVPLSCAAHTAAMYRRLPHGWRTTPEGPTDLFMWQQFLSDPACRAVSGTRPTAIVFPSSERKRWTPEERARELASWSARLARPGSAESLAREAVAFLAGRCAQLEVEKLARDRPLVDAELRKITGTATWKLRRRALSVPIVSALLHKAARFAAEATEPRPGRPPAFAFEPGHLAALAGRHRSAYAAAAPFPHAVLDDFFPTEAAERLLAEFPPPARLTPDHDPSEPRRRGKLVSRSMSVMSPFTVAVLTHLNSPAFLRFLTELTGIEGLEGNPDVADSLRHYEPGGCLGIHADFNWNPALKRHRRLNLLVYLNKGWDEAWKGQLELWDPEGNRCVRSVTPVFNRAVIFNSTDTSLHGFPDPLACPEGVTRKSLQLYYYTRTRPACETAPPHGTLFRWRPGEKPDRPG
jgi:hypothetical protein